MRRWRYLFCRSSRWKFSSSVWPFADGTKEQLIKFFASEIFRQWRRNTRVENGLYEWRATIGYNSMEMSITQWITFCHEVVLRDTQHGKVTHNILTQRNAGQDICKEYTPKNDHLFKVVENRMQQMNVVLPILFIVVNNIVQHCYTWLRADSGSTMLNNIVDNYEQCGQHNIVASCFQQPWTSDNF